ncbi:WecB/TagA/CpsF family glycosyltransferase [Microbacterium enclense]|uniref:WecB/TagA/CpsF family glycosyltransferase n=1 Tax=Microbacterium enclense TaxID=993073 RepID=UPI0036DEFEDC
MQMSLAKRGIAVRLSNAYCVALADSDAVYQRCLTEGVVFPDGAPVAAVMKLKNLRAASITGRVRGPSFFSRSLSVSRDHNLRHFFLGSSDKNLEKLLAAVVEEFPGLQVAGSYSPPFAPVDEGFVKLCLASLDGAGADIVWLGLGTPKQDLLATHLSRHLDVPVIGVGAAFDFKAGSVREAPKLMQHLGLEWLFRFAVEPRRLWRRYLLGNVRFIYASIRDWRRK